MQETGSQGLRLTTAYSGTSRKSIVGNHPLFLSVTFEAILLVSDHEAQISSSYTIVLDDCCGNGNDHFTVCRYPFH